MIASKYVAKPPSLKGWAVTPIPIVQQHVYRVLFSLVVDFLVDFPTMVDAALNILTDQGPHDEHFMVLASCENDECGC